MKRKPKKKPLKGMKRCPVCKGDKVCKTCDGHGQVRIVQGRKKGGTFERDTAKQVSDWTGVEFKRTPMSGGWAKTGDITPKNPKAMTKFPFNIECKNQEVFSTASLVEYSRKGELPTYLKKWWKQCTDDAKKSKKIPLLVMTRAREPVYVMTTRTVFNGLDLMKKASFVIRFSGLRVMLWDEFLSKSYNDIVEKLGE